MTRVLSKEFDLGRLMALGAKFWSWWTGELAFLLPKGLPAFLARKGTALVLDLGKKQTRLTIAEPGSVADTVTVANRDFAAGLRRALERLPAGRRPDRIAIRLEPALVHETGVEIPKAAAGELARVVALQIERMFPLIESEVHWTLTGTTPREGGSLRVGFAVVKRSALAPLFAALAAAGVSTRKLALSYGGETRTVFFPVAIPPVLRRAWTPLGSLRAPLPLSLAVWAALFVGYLGFLEVRANLLAERVGDERTLLAEDSRLIAAFEQGRERERVLAGMMGEPLPAAVLEELALRLPEGAWVETLSLRDGKIVLEGHHRDPASLVKGLEDSLIFSGATLLSLSETPGADPKFMIALDLSGEGTT